MGSYKPKLSKDSASPKPPSENKHNRPVLIVEKLKKEKSKKKESISNLPFN